MTVQEPSVSSSNLPAHVKDVLCPDFDYEMGLFRSQQGESDMEQSTDMKKFEVDDQPLSVDDFFKHIKIAQDKHKLEREQDMVKFKEEREKDLAEFRNKLGLPPELKTKP